jgi:(p)ppGpp synthase/HD superfamily hydrolase
MTQLQKALELCKEAHKGQFRKDGVTPYHTHPIAVAKLVSSEEEKIVAFNMTIAINSLVMVLFASTILSHS